MDSLFGDASTAIRSTAVGDETGPLTGSSSAAGPVDYRSRPDLVPDPPDLDGDDDGKPGKQATSGKSGGIGDWISRFIWRARGKDGENEGGVYAPLQQRED